MVYRAVLHSVVTLHCIGVAIDVVAHLPLLHSGVGSVVVEGWLLPLLLVASVVVWWWRVVGGSPPRIHYIVMYCIGMCPIACIALWCIILYQMALV